MELPSIKDITTSIKPLDTNLSADAPPTGEHSFSNVLASVLGSANDAQWAAGNTTEDLVTGKMQSTHAMTIAGAKAEVMLHLTTQVASKLSQATTQLFQMQI